MTVHQHSNIHDTAPLINPMQGSYAWNLKKYIPDNDNDNIYWLAKKQHSSLWPIQHR